MIGPRSIRTVGGLAAVVGGRILGDGTVSVADVRQHSGEVTPGSLFACVTGTNRDGHDLAADAVRSGASALLVERDLHLGVPSIVVPDVRSALGPLCAAFWGHPELGCRVIGVTGTNGKTTFVTLVGALADRLGIRTRVSGTLTGARTTPEVSEVFRLLADERDAGTDLVAMEVSSHALSLHRVDGVRFNLAVFTNLGRDHLDFHPTQEAYFAAKAELFTSARSDRALVNVDDVHGRLLRDAADVPTSPYSLADASGVASGPEGMSFTWRGTQTRTGLLGRHNLSNLLAALESLRLCGVPVADLAQVAPHTSAAPGRFELVLAGQPFTVAVDYAHTPDALRGVLGAGREIAGGHRVILVFGCGGDRDPGKRPEMGRVAAEYSDLVVLTDDNPRSENPDTIREQVLAGVVGQNPAMEPDRRSAIGLALDAARPGDVVIIAGKGHETTQTYADRVEDFDDRVVVRAELRSRGWDASSPPGDRP